jgi:hypothetical protein
MEFLGVILLIAAAICLWIWRSRRSGLTTIGATETYTASLLDDIHRQITTAVGADALAQRCEVAGVVEVDTPLIGKISGKMCVAYNFNISREYEEPVTETDSQGKSQTRMQRGSETLESGDVRAPFYVRDETGRVLVDPEGAEIDWQDTASVFEQANDPGLARRRNLGTRRTEKALMVGDRVFVLGHAVDHGGRAAVARGPKGDRMIISRKSERQLITDMERGARNLLIAASVCGGLGLVALLWGLLT